MGRKPPSGSPADWMRHCRSDLEVARSRRANVLLETLCFHSQQAAEKAIKAVLISKGIEIPRTHNIRMLTDLVPAGCPGIPQADDVARLTDYAVTSRYPGDFEPVTESEYKEAVRLAESVVQWAEKNLA